MFEIGSSLREARVRQDVDFPALEQATKIRAKYLRALEDERFELLPAHTYVKGFLRSYADFLGLDGQLYVDEYNSRYVVGDEETPLRARRAPRVPARRVAAASGVSRAPSCSRSRRSASSRRSSSWRGASAGRRRAACPGLGRGPAATHGRAGRRSRAAAAADHALGPERRHGLRVRRGLD